MCDNGDVLFEGVSVMEDAEATEFEMCPPTLRGNIVKLFVTADDGEPLVVDQTCAA